MKNIQDHFNVKVDNKLINLESIKYYSNGILESVKSFNILNDSIVEKYEHRVQIKEINGYIVSYDYLKNCTILGFGENRIDKTTIEDLIDLEELGFNIISITDNSFEEDEIVGSFPLLSNLEYIGDRTFYSSEFSGSFPKLEKLKYIGDFSFLNSKFISTFPVLNNLEYIGGGVFGKSIFTGTLNLPNVKIIETEKESISIYSAFRSSKFTGLNIPNIESIGNRAFVDCEFSGAFPKLDKLKYIGKRVFYNSEFSGTFPKLDKLEYIGDFSFLNSKFISTFPVLNNLEYIGGGVFGKSIFTGTLNLPNVKIIETEKESISVYGSFHSSKFTGLNIPNIESIGNNAFVDCEFSGAFPKLDKLKYIGNRTFYSSEFSGTFPKLDKLEYIGDFSFLNSKFISTFPVLNNLEYIGGGVFGTSIFTGTLNLPNVKIIETEKESISAYGSFYSSKFTGLNIPNIESIGNRAFINSEFTGTFPKLDKLKYIGNRVFFSSEFNGSFPVLNNLEYIDSGVFAKSIFTGTFPVLDNVVYIGDTTFGDSEFYGVFPTLNNLEEIGPHAFSYSKFRGTAPWISCPKLSRSKVGDGAFYNSNFN